MVENFIVKVAQRDKTVIVSNQKFNLEKKSKTEKSDFRKIKFSILFSKKMKTRTNRRNK